MQKTFPHADTITLETGHLSPEHPDAPRLVREWLENKDDVRIDSIAHSGQSTHIADLNAAVRRRALSTPSDVAVFSAKRNVRTTWNELNTYIQNAGAGLRAKNAHVGDRVAILAPFDERTIAFIYACWAEGVVPVVADPGLGIKNMRRALRESHPQFVLTQRATRVVARLLHLAYRAKRLDVVEMTSFTTQVDNGVSDISPDDVAAVLYTSGATGAAKGVVYTHGQLCALAQAIQKQFSITDEDGIAAAYIPFALYGPAWGVGVGLPKVNVLAPGKLSADNLRIALTGVNGTILFAAPAPLKNVVKGNEVFPSVRCVMSAGAPVGDTLLQEARKSFINANFFSPYGMTEMLIVSDGIRGELSSTRGVPVGQPLPDVSTMILPFGWKHGDDIAPLPHAETGEVFVTGPWLSRGYDQHWCRNRNARVVHEGRQWHRTGDVGHVNNGLFIEGRIAHVIHLQDSVVTPVPIEQAVEKLFPRVMAAAVGVVRNGKQGLAVILSDGSTSGRADSLTTKQIVSMFPLVEAVLYKKELPVDRRHNSKIDRTLLSLWATEQLAKQ
jgi:acyl-CoA synthetase (AMP-forming)/AMP-acid ligase II